MENDSVLKKGGIYRVAMENLYTFKRKFPSIKIGNVRARYIGEQRPPKMGEYFFSGNPITAYVAFCDLEKPYPIAQIVTIKTIEVVDQVLE